jgi:hypothetical protein
VAFDAYHKWLAIPPAEQPPNHYRLLGLPLFENDQEVIAAAAVQRMNWVRKFQKGETAEAAVKITKEITQAWARLLNVEQKQRYDTALKLQEDAKELTREVAATALLPPQAISISPPAVPTFPPVIPNPPLVFAPKRGDEPKGKKQRPPRSIPNFDSGEHAFDAPLAPAIASAASSATPPPNAAAHPRPSDLELDFHPPASADRKEKSKRKQSSFGVQLLKNGTAGIVGLVLGYLILCAMGPQYDFLELLGSNKPAPSAPSEPKPETEEPRSKQPPQKRERTPKPPLPELDPKIPEVNARMPIPQEERTAEPTPREPTHPPIVKHSVPPDQELEPARQAVRQLYSEEELRNTNADAKCALAKQLVANAMENESDVPRMYALLERAAELSATSGKFDDDLWLPIEEFEKRFEIDGIVKRRDSLAQAMKLANTPEEFKLAANSWLTLADSLVAQDRYEEAAACAKQAEFAAPRSVDPILMRRVKLKVVQTNEMGAAYATALPARQQFEQFPDDSASAAIWGEFLCLYKNDWDTGLALSSRDPSNKFAAITQKDLAMPESVDLQAALGDQWYSATLDQQSAVVQQNLKRRAAHWYQRALPGLSGARRAEIEQSLSAIESEFSSIPTGSWIEVLGTVHPQRNVSKGTWGRRDKGTIFGTLSAGEFFVPVAIDGSYDCEVIFTLGSTKDGKYKFLLSVPAGDREASISLDNKERPRIAMDSAGSDNSSSTIPLLANRLHYKLKVSVKPSVDQLLITADLEGKRLLTWNGPASSIPATSANRTLRLNTTSPIAIHNIKLHVVSGNAKLLED